MIHIVSAPTNKSVHLEDMLTIVRYECRLYGVHLCHSIWTTVPARTEYIWLSPHPSKHGGSPTRSTLSAYRTVPPIIHLLIAEPAEGNVFLGTISMSPRRPTFPNHSQTLLCNKLGVESHFLVALLWVEIFLGVYD